MPKCLLCGKKTWFFKVDCDCKSKRLKERARPIESATVPLAPKKEVKPPVQSRRVSVEPTKSVHGRSMSSDTSDCFATMQQNTMMTQALSLDSDLAQTESKGGYKCTPSDSSPSSHHSTYSPSYESPSSFDSTPSYDSGGGSSSTCD